MKHAQRLIARLLLVCVLIPTSALAQQIPSPGGSSTANVSTATGYLPTVNGGNTYNAIVTNSPYNASGFIAQTTTSSSVSSGSTVIPVNSTSGFNTGQIAYVSLGGTSGTKNFAGTISSISPGASITLASASVTLPQMNGGGTLWSLTSSSGASGLTTTVPQGYLVYSMGMTAINGAIASGATSVTVNNAASYAVGQGLFIYTGTSSTVGQVVSITGISGNVITFTPGIVNASGVASGVFVQHDDTAAFQAAANLVTQTQNVNLYVPDGYYQLNGPEITNVWAPVSLPSLDYYPSSFAKWLPQASLTIQGNVPAPQEQSYLATQKIPHESGAILQSNLGDGNNAAGFFGAYDSNSDNNITNIKLVVRNLTFRTYPAPYLNSVAGTHMESLQEYGVDIDTGDTGNITQATTYFSNNGAIAGPIGNNGGNNVYSDIQISGYYFGIWATEHTRLEHVRIDNTFQPILAGSAYSNYGITMVDVEFNGCPHGIGAAPGVPSIPIEASLLNIEHNTTPSWVSPVDDISDSSNLLLGNISIDAQTSQTITITGAAYLNVFNPHKVGQLAGTTAGTVTYFQPQISGSAKTFTGNFSRYENNTATNQTITFPAPFTKTPVVSINNTTLTVAATTTTLTITSPDTATTYNGTVQVTGN
jgi:hypothetical protein